MKNILIAGPDHTMEFGWMLMLWQAKIRALSRMFDKTYIITKPSWGYFYKDFGYPIDALKEPSSCCGLHNAKTTFILPSKSFCCNMDYKSEFVKYGIRSDLLTPKYKNCVIIHPRKKDDEREWNIRKWVEFIKKLPVSVKLYVVGSHNETHDVFIDKCVFKLGITDLRGLNINSYPVELFNASMIIGPSSGAMHMASLMGIPQLVWTDDKKWNLGFTKDTNRVRYRTAWNPLKTPVRVLDKKGWNPPVDYVLEQFINHYKVGFNEDA